VITESVKSWRIDVPAKFVNALGLDKVMFEAAEPEVFAWYIKNYGPEVNLFVDHSQIVQWNACDQASGEPKASGAVSLPTKGSEEKTN
jgi:phosphosulfolactate synthase (CoM biosynthesis protein A)